VPISATSKAPNAASSIMIMNTESTAQHGEQEQEEHIKHLYKQKKQNIQRFAFRIIFIKKILY
jgi:hypothetical protein